MRHMIVMSKQRDKQIIELVKNGDVTAFSELINAYQQMAFTLSNSILKNREEAQEATQDSFVKVFQKLNEFRGDSAFSSWLYKIVYHTSLSKLRLRKKSGLSLDENIIREYDVINDYQENDILENHDKQKMLKLAMSELKDDDAAIVLLFYYKELSIDEITEITGLSQSNVKIKLHRSRKQLQDRLLQLMKNELSSLL